MYSADTNHGIAHPSGKERLWLSPSVLTSKNPDTSNPKIAVDDAAEVFDALRKRRLLTPMWLEVADKQGTQREVTVFIVNRERKDDWNNLVSKNGFFSMKASPIIYYFFGSENPWFWLCFAFIAAAFFGELFKQFGDDAYKALKAFILPMLPK